MSSFHSSTVKCLLEQPTGSHRVKYHGAGDHSIWDFALETEHRPVDVSLVLPHYRARNQPFDHRLSMYVRSERAESMKVKVFQLEVHSASNADITIWLPSDFRGRIHRSAHCRRVSFSAGFTNRIMQNVCMTQSRRPSLVAAIDKHITQYSDIYISDDAGVYSEKEHWNAGYICGGTEEDEVIVHTAGHVTFRMWDARCREACKRVLGLGWCAKRAPEVAIDWDFLWTTSDHV
ncbi:uncharacterized protein B0H18DRAFT_1082689 [Fomitopsis serialis]|uniref:uncharacterized protein n=1 Tax=Fomitopsis serialis TaxID=139415 RepID=UPI0020078C44|nr:uncharacterized protein B0H18DRAFT_1082689 [Neoantrodia serialis]KAH9934961.1 hypothetical protein B0H18DRAFT_1082689 [Neoantrodia serialis]